MRCSDFVSLDIDAITSYQLGCSLSVQTAELQSELLDIPTAAQLQGDIARIKQMILVRALACTQPDLRGWRRTGGDPSVRGAIAY